MANTLTFSPTQKTGLFGSPTTQTSTSPVGTSGTYANPQSGVFGVMNRIGQNVKNVGTTGYNPVPIMGTQANSPVNNVTPPSNTISPSQGLLAPGQKTTQGNQASPQPVVPTSPVQPTTPTGGSSSTVAPSNPFTQSVTNLSNTQPNSGSTGATTNLNSQSVTTPTNATSAQGLLGNFAQNQTPAVTQALNALQAYQATNPLAQVSAAGNNPNELANIATGAAANMANASNQYQANLIGNLNAAVGAENQQIGSAENLGTQALTGQQQQIGASNYAGNLANTAQANQINAQGQVVGLGYGLPSTSGASGGNLDPQSYASNLAQQVISGKMTLADAQSMMGYAGSAGSAFLQQAISQASPGFNFAQASNPSNVQAQTSLGPQANLALNELNNYASTIQNTPYQNTTFPALNAVAGWIKGMVGSGSAANLNQSRTAAINAVGTALATAYGGTPTNYDNMTNSWFPADASPAQIQTGVQQFMNLINYRTQSYGSVGTTQNPVSDSTDTSGSTQNISGLNFTKDANGNWISQ